MSEERGKGGRGVTDTFVVQPVKAGGWDYIAAALARLFGRLRSTTCHHCVIVEVGPDAYVQFIVRPDGGLWSESIGDVHIDGDGFDEDQHRELELLGWNTPELFGRGHGNYWREYESPGHDLDAATIAVMTCIDVFGAGPRTRVKVVVFEAVGARG